jgi:hypothetical protein
MVPRAWRTAGARGFAPTAPTHRKNASSNRLYSLCSPAGSALLHRTTSMPFPTRAIPAGCLDESCSDPQPSAFRLASASRVRRVVGHGGAWHVECGCAEGRGQGKGLPRARAHACMHGVLPCIGVASSPPYAHTRPPLVHMPAQAQPLRGRRRRWLVAGAEPGGQRRRGGGGSGTQHTASDTPTAAPAAGRAQHHRHSRRCCGCGCP